MPGLIAFGTTVQAGFRGMHAIGNTLFSAWSGKAVRHGTSGGAETVLTGTLPGTQPVIFARNNAALPDLVAVAPGDGAFVVTNSSVSAYPDVDVGQPNSVTNIRGFFIYTYGDGKMRSSDVNSTNINTLNSATAESKPDTLFRSVPLPNGQMLACGSESLEVWGGINDTGFVFSYITTIDMGIAGPYCIAGYEDGWGQGLFLVGSDFGVHKLTGYQLSKISTPDLDRLIQAVADKTTILMSVHVADGHSFLVVQSPTWSWEYDINTSTWQERKSYQQQRWRGIGGHKFNGKWYVGDALSANIIQIDPVAQTEISQPLVAILETGPMGNFPNGARINRLDLFMSVGVGVATGIDPIETDPSIEISISRDNGLTWSIPWLRRLGKQMIGNTKVTVNNLGHVGPQGAKFRFQISDPVHVALMGGDLDLQVLGK
ncbi:packaged DNA stabilization protein [Bradyrhizobium sp.]|uniref:packaged DNA stabilization protein n=1 Tax=Bradyrhizobium sp. TaxID=376 RepID=UPI0025B8944A|nr:packaged DNA stabilization protein [Bradyrhizobium sp.]